MQKYLLLLLMCLVGMIEAQAGIKVDEVGNKSYVLTFTNGTTDNDWNSLSKIKSATSVKIVTDGYKLSTNDMKKLTGESANATPFFANLTTLDLEKAELTSYDDLQYIGFDNLKKLETFSFPEKTDTIPLLDNKGLFQGNNHIKTVLMYENPDNKDLSSFKVIPDYTFQNATNLTTVRIPEGVEVIGTSAFAGASEGKAPKIASIHFPNTLKRIEYNAFAYNSELTSVTIPANVTAIGNSAFQHNKNLEDVYVLGNHVITCDGSFNEEYTYNGFTYDNNNDGNGSVVSIKDWKSDKDFVKHPLRLHIPKDSEAYRYCVNPFLRALNALTKEELALIDTYNSNESIRNKLSSYGINPSNLYLFQNNWVEMDGHRYFKKPQAMFNEDSHAQNLISADIAQGNANYTDFNGWHNFMFAAGDIDEKIWEDGRIVESRWYSAVFPFDMSYNQVMTTYGAKTDVREFSYVNQHSDDDGKEVRTVSFLKIPEIPNNDKNAAGFVKKGRPYMIHPGVRVVPVKKAAGGAQSSYYRSIAGVDVTAANEVVAKNTDLEEVKGDLIKNAHLRSGREVKEPKAYTFKGSYKDGDIPANTFYLGMWPNQPETLAFYVATKELKGKWTAFTSVVRKVEPSTNSYAKTMDLGFESLIDDDFGITTAVENAAVKESSNSQVVYNLSGQAVRENNASLEGLSKGVYVVNGKKIVVR